MTDFAQTLQDLPLASLVPVVLMVVVGLLMWAAGRKLLRTGFAAAGLLLGGAVGWVVGENLNMGAPPILVALAAGIALACLAALAYRLAVAGALSMVLAVAAALAVVAVGEFQTFQGESDASAETAPAPSGEQPTASPGADDDHDTDDPTDLLPNEPEPDVFDEWLNQRIRERLPEGIPGDALPQLSSDELVREFGLNDDAREHVQQVKSLTQGLLTGISEIWNQTPAHLRPMIIAAGVIGALLGMLIGALAPMFSAAVVTSFGGTLLWLTGVRIIVERFADGAFMPSSGRAWLSLWIITSLIGLCIQWMFRPQPADKGQR